MISPDVKGDVYYNVVQVVHLEKNVKEGPHVLDCIIVAVSVSKNERFSSALVFRHVQKFRPHFKHLSLLTFPNTSMNSNALADINK